MRRSLHLSILAVAGFWLDIIPIRGLWSVMREIHENSQQICKNKTSGDDKKKNRLFKKPRGRQHNDLASQPSEVTSSHTNQVSYVLVNINRQDDKSNELSTIYNTIR